MTFAVFYLLPRPTRHLTLQRYLPDLPRLFWTQAAEQVAYWQNFCAQPDPDSPPLDAMHEVCIARLKTRLKRIDAGKNPGRSLFELSDYVACLN